MNRIVFSGLATLPTYLGKYVPRRDCIYCNSAQGVTAQVPHRGNLHDVRVHVVR